MSVPAKPTPDTAPFHIADILFVRAWAARAPGLGGWRVSVEPQDRQAHRVLVVPPGAEQPVFFISRRDGGVLIERRRPAESGSGLVIAGRCESLREAVQRLCPLDGDTLQAVNEYMEQAHPRGPRH